MILPKCVLIYLCGYLQKRDILNLSLVSKDFRRKINYFINDKYFYNCGIKSASGFYIDFSSGIIDYTRINVISNFPVKLNNFKNLVSLIMNFNRKIIVNLPTLKYLKFGDNFMETIDGFNCKNLLTLEFGYFFNRPITFQYPYLQRLKFGNNFNQKLSFNLSCLKYLRFGNDFNRSLKEANCENLETLIFGSQFNQPLREYEKLSKLIFGAAFNQIIKSEIPNVKKISFGRCFDHPIVFKSKLEKLQIDGIFNLDLNLNNFEFLTHVMISGDFDKKLNISLLFLEELDLGCSRFDSALILQCPELKKLKLSPYFNRRLDLFCGKLISIIFGSCFNKPVNQLPESLKELKFGGNFNQSIDYLPINLEYLFLCKNFDKPLSTFLKRAKNLKHLVIDSGIIIPYEDLIHTKLF